MLILRREQTISSAPRPVQTVLYFAQVAFGNHQPKSSLMPGATANRSRGRPSSNAAPVLSVLRPSADRPLTLVKPVDSSNECGQAQRRVQALGARNLFPKLWLEKFACTPVTDRSVEEPPNGLADPIAGGVLHGQVLSLTPEKPLP